MTIAGAITNLQTLVGAIAGIRSAPDYPPDNLSTFPVAVAYCESGRFQSESYGAYVGFHVLALEIHWKRSAPLRALVETTTPYAESVYEAIIADVTLSGAIDSMEPGDITYTHGPMAYGEPPVDTFGYRFLIPIKVKGTYT